MNGQRSAWPTIAIVGATGVVGREVVEILASRGHPAERIRLFASARSAGSVVAVGEVARTVEAFDAADPPDLAGVDFVVGATDADTARVIAVAAERAGAVFVDNSSAFRHAPGVPLVIPEVNGELLDSAPRPAVVANPNCSTILLLVALEPLRRHFGLSRVVVATYQAVSGAGAAAVAEFDLQLRAAAGGEPLTSEVFPAPIVGNVFSHESPVDAATGHNGEEAKMVAECRRILASPGLRVAPTCVRVPVRRAHSQAITVELVTPGTVDEVRAAFAREAGSCGIEIVDDRATGRAPTPLLASGRDEVFVGRLRAAADAILDERGATRDHALFASMDQLRKGAAWNAIQIVDRLGR